MSFILDAKPGDHKRFFEEFQLAGSSQQNVLTRDTDVTVHIFRWVNGLPQTEKNQDIVVNFLDYKECRSSGKSTHFSWVTDIEITEENVKEIMREGRTRWKIENETFNTLKNQGYQFEHNFGHGYKNLIDSASYFDDARISNGSVCFAGLQICPRRSCKDEKNERAFPRNS